MKKLFLAAVMSCYAVGMMAQHVDFDMTGRNSSEVTEPDYESWAVARVASDTKTLASGIKLTISASEGATALASNWNKNILILTSFNQFVNVFLVLKNVNTEPRMPFFCTFAVFLDKLGIKI